MDEVLPERVAEPRVSGLSRQQSEILEAIALLPRLDPGRFAAADLRPDEGRGRVESASRARAIRSLEDRGLVCHVAYADAKPHSRSHHLRLTPSGVKVVNEFRRWHNLPEVSYAPPPPPLTDEEFNARLRAIRLHGIKHEIQLLDPADRAEIRRWLAELDTAAKGAGAEER